MTRNSSVLSLASLVLLLALGAAPVDAKSAVGDRAFDFVGKEFVNADPFTLADVRGKLLLYEFIGTG